MPREMSHMKVKFNDTHKGNLNHGGSLLRSHQKKLIGHRLYKLSCKSICNYKGRKFSYRRVGTGRSFDGSVKVSSLVKANGYLIDDKPDVLCNNGEKVGGGDYLMADPGNPKLTPISTSTDNTPEEATPNFIC